MLALTDAMKPSAPRSPRFLCHLPVRYHVFDASSGELELGPVHATYAQDIGESGLFLALAKLKPGAQIHFFVEFPAGLGGCVEAFGRVTHARPEGVGVRIVRLARGERRTVDAYLTERSAIEAAVVSAARARFEAEQAVAARATRPGQLSPAN